VLIVAYMSLQLRSRNDDFADASGAKVDMLPCCPKASQLVSCSITIRQFKLPEPTLPEQACKASLPRKGSKLFKTVRLHDPYHVKKACPRTL